MLSATYTIASNTISYNFADLYSHTSNCLNIILRFLIKLKYILLLSCFLLFGTCLSAQPIKAAEDGIADTPNATFFRQQPQSPLPTSSQTFSFDDVYRLELNLDIPGNIKIIAIDSKEEDKDKISVTLEKRVREHNPLLTVFTKTFLENISITGTKKDGTLQLNSLLPPEVSKAIFENRSESEIKEHLHLSYVINTPPDVSVQLKIKEGDVYIHHIRGKIEITNEMGRVHLDETLGNYHVEVKQGGIHGKILLAPGQSKIKTDNGSIDLTILDDLAAPLDLTALGGNIGLLLPSNYPADVKLNSEKLRYIINLPAEIDSNGGIINGGGPLLRLTATNTISVLPNPRLRSRSKNSESTESEDTFPSEFVQPIPQTLQPPTIDGNLSEKAWLNAAQLSAFQNPTGTETAENLTDVYLLWDAQNLYIGGRAHFANYQVPRISQTQHDSPMWEDDSVEILLDMNLETDGYPHLIINPISGTFDQWVQKVGFPNFRFAPPDVSREPIDKSIEKFKADSSWNSDAKVATQINANFWSFEVAFPRSSTGKKDKNTWLFNVHRKAQGKQGSAKDFKRAVHREYSYWLPIYDEEYPWWPHWKEGMGTLKLVKDQPSTSETFGISENFKVTAVEIDGNKTIPTEVVLHRIPITAGNTFTNEQLSRLIAELEYFDWFQEVQLKTTVLETNEAESPPISSSSASLRDVESESPVNSKTEDFTNSEPLEVTVQIVVTEAPVKFAKQIRIKGNRSFPALFIKNWFDLNANYLSVASLKLKGQMITDFYVNRGFAFAEVTHDFVNDTLQYNINEGSLDEIRFTGIRRISHNELTAALGLDTKDIYFHSLGQSKINELQKKLSKSNEAFKSIRDWHVQREGGKNILIVDIEEQPFIKPGWYPIVGFNRVHGVVLGAGGTLSTHFTGEEQLFGSISGGFASKILNYSLGAEKSFFRRFPLTMGIGLFKVTDSSSNAFRLLPYDSSLNAAVYGTTHDNYYQREGEQIWISQTFGTSSLLRLEFTQENHDNLFKSTDWSYFDRTLPKRDNARIDRGHLKMISLGYTFDTRDQKSRIKRPQYLGSYLLPWPNERTRRGWRGHFGAEMAGGFLGGEYKFNLYKFKLVRYTSLFGPHQLNFRLSGDFSNEPLPRQRILYLGGASTVRGYGFNTYAGDKRILLNIEYRFFEETRINTNMDAAFGWAFSAFFDTGQVWQFDENPLSDFSLSHLKTAIGVGMSFIVSPPGDFQPLSTAVEIAYPINVVSSLRKPRIIWRLERMF
jgi:outer membrane protein assembly factor BamA